MLLTSRSRKRLSLCFGVFGIGLMGADLLITQDFFTHVAELMAASIICFITALLLDRSTNQQNTEEKN